MDQIRVLISEEEISDAVKRLGEVISSDFSEKSLTVIGILTGSIVLVTDLIRQITVPHQLGFIQASSYRGETTTAGILQTSFDFLPDILGRDVLLVDDIFDTGRTLSKIQVEIQKLKPRSVRTAVLLWKTERRQVQTVPDYSCFQIPDEFVVGYGLDYNQHYRHIPYIGVMSSAGVPQTGGVSAVSDSENGVQR